MAGVTQWYNKYHLRHFYVTVIRPVLEYCSVVWHHGLTNAQAESLEAIQRRALRIIYPVTYDFPYDAALSIAQIIRWRLFTTVENS